MVRGAIGTELKLEVRSPDGTSRQISLIREKMLAVANTAPEWVVATLPKPDPQGWITLFDGERVYGANPTNANFVAGNVFLKNGMLVMDSSGGYNGGVRFKWQGTNVTVRVHARRLSGQNLGISFGGYSAWYGGETLCGIGQTLRGKYNDLKTANLPRPIDGFFAMEFQLIRDDLKLLMNGAVKVQVKAPWVEELRGLNVSSLKGVALFKKSRPGKSRDEPRSFEVAKSQMQYETARHPCHNCRWFRLAAAGGTATGDVKGRSVVLAPPCSLCTLWRMAHKLRVEYPGAIYHVLNRGDRREAIFQDDQDRD